jgi:hypothetical protein
MGIYFHCRTRRIGIIKNNYNFMAVDAVGMKGYRSRNESGLLRNKRDDTHMGTIERQYNRDFGVRSDMELGTYLKKSGCDSFSDLIHGEK